MKLLSVKSAHLRRFLVSTTCMVVVSACSLGNQHHVRKGTDPRYQDEDVAFRTTYYFRVFDYCATQARGEHASATDKAKYEGIPEIDSLYRFRMTGKSNTLRNKIHFESGSLKSWELDPLGANVIFDENTGRFRFQSKAEADLEAKQKRAWADYKRLLKEYEELSTISEKDTPRQIEIVGGALSILLHDEIQNNGDITNNNVSMLTSKLAGHVDAQEKYLDNLNEGLHRATKNKVTSVADSKIREITEETKSKVLKSAQEWVHNQIVALRAEYIAAQWANIKASGGVAAIPDENAWLNHFPQMMPNDFSSASNTGFKETIASVVSGADENAAVPIAQNFFNSVFGNASPFSLQNTITTSPHLFLLNSNQLKALYQELQNEADTTKHDSIVASATTAVAQFDKDKDPDMTGSLSKVIKDTTQLDSDYRMLVKAILITEVTRVVEQAVADQLGKIKLARVPQSTLLTLQQAINDKLRLATGTPKPLSTKPGLKIQSDKGVNTAIDCTNVTQRRGFQILGPEGWRTFNPDDRLIMAMRSSAEPLTGVLNQLSQRVLKSHEAKKTDIMPLVEARLRTSDAQRSLEQTSAFGDAEESSGTKSPTVGVCKLVNTLTKTLVREKEALMLAENASNENSDELKCGE